MALRFVSGGNTFTLSTQDLERYPESLLHSLVTSLDHVDEPVSLRVDQLSGSPLATWPAALEATIALYKGQQLTLETLSTSLESHTESDLCEKLEGLLDYLNVQEPITILFPPQCSIPIWHVGVLGLHYHMVARDVVDLITGFTAFSCSPVATSLQDRGYFYITAKGDGSSIVSVAVFAVGGWSLKRKATALCDATDTMAVNGKSGPTAVRLSCSGPALDAGRCLMDVVRDTAAYGRGVSRQHKALGGRVAALLQAALSRVPVSGCTRSVQVRSVTAYFSSYVNDSCTRAPLWVVHW